MAAGFSLREEDVDEFRRRLNENARERLTEDNFIPRVWIDVAMPFEYISESFVKELELLEHEHYGKITLTDAGRDTAKNILDTNKIVYRFLTEILDVDEQTALAEADLMEHDISKGTRKKLKKFIKKSTDKKSADKKAK